MKSKVKLVAGTLDVRGKQLLIQLDSRVACEQPTPCWTPNAQLGGKRFHPLQKVPGAVYDEVEDPCKTIAAEQGE